MSKKVLLASVSVIIFSATTFAKSDFSQDIDANTFNKGFAPIVEEAYRSPLPADLIVDFAKFSYSVDKKAGWATSDKEIYNKLINNDWILDTFNGTTGRANSQIESVSGLLAFKGNHVVIATRGTEMTNWNDWMTNVRFSRSPITRFFSADESNKLGAVTAQFFGGIDGEVANGFLQTHLSSWDYIRQAIIKRAEVLGISPKDLQYTITGHSKGAAKAQLNAVSLLTDSVLGVGVDYLDNSFIESDNLEESGYYGIEKMTAPENRGNVRTVAFESPRVFSHVASKQVDYVIGVDNLVRVESKSKTGYGYDVDPVTLVGPEALGFKHAGTPLEIDGKGTFANRHAMDNVAEAAIPAIDAHSASVAQKKAAAKTTRPVIVTKEVEPEATKRSYFSQSVMTTQSIVKGAASLVQKAWGYFWK